jgi:hypothetical protein
MARKIALSLGIFVALLPYLGFPDHLDTILFTVSGLVIAFLAWSGKRVPPPLPDEVEGELREVTNDPAGASPEMEKKNSLTPVSPEVHSMPDSSHQEGNKALAVSFTKQRQRNLSKRITQEGGESSS